MGLRSPRLVILVIGLFVCISLYSIFPSGKTRVEPHSPQEPYEAYEQGGIDSPEHWNEPVMPDFDKEEARYLDESHAEMKQAVDSSLGGWFGMQPAGEPGAGIGPGQGGQPPLSHSGSEDGAAIPHHVLHGDVIMPKLDNDTARAELGRAAWRVAHLMTLRYPEKPTASDRDALKSYFHLFARLYPCGQCAQEFQALLKEYPPQTSSRKSASLWLCHVHNQVNLRLGKDEFDCLTLDETYDCGCGDEPVDSVAGAAEAAGQTTKSTTKGPKRPAAASKPKPAPKVEDADADAADAADEEASNGGELYTAMSDEDEERFASSSNSRPKGKGGSGGRKPAKTDESEDLDEPEPETGSVSTAYPAEDDVYEGMILEDESIGDNIYAGSAADEDAPEDEPRRKWTRATEAYELASRGIQP